MKSRKLVIAFALAVLVALAVPTTAFANFAIHGNYVADTDACAGCHRAHTSISSITWQSGPSDRSALLVSSATQMWEFCYACHDATGQGADTNVQEGIYEGDTYGEQFAVLNGGGFESLDQSATTSTHMYQGASWGAYGGGYYGGTPYPDGQIAGADIGESVPIKMDCATCHDPHGSANYRILKAQVNGNAVGGYVGAGTDPTPDGWVSSVETGWPLGGFELHKDYPNYKPDYTTPMYAKGRTTTSDAAAKTGMSGWCAGCHQTYLREAEMFTKSDGSTYTASASVYNAGDGGGLKLRHRHPINVPLSNFNGAVALVADSGLPLANSLTESATAGPRVADTSDWIECLTCHRAHGTSSTMTGFASAAGAASVVDTDGVARNLFPASESALLRKDNRGVCEACHNK
ncbi:MAG: hypothetical protein CVT67_09565 [Actinobacteria bacterium HGW-Actinobacteria-7]|jgi:predicted CXXCH cytochrome family protein|nr:MAG: hypothetical protein CVT67_09565 [Actinobacteria bacterium HGW-Actinobacteria-7]